MGAAQYLEGIESSKAFGSGQYIKGEGRFTVTSRRLFVSDGHKGKFVIFEFVVDSSNSETDPVGATRSWVLPLQGPRAKRTLGEFKNLIFALTGDDPKDVGGPEENPQKHNEAGQLAMAAVDEAFAKKSGIDPELLVGQQVGLETRFKPTQNGGTFTVHDWFPA